METTKSNNNKGVAAGGEPTTPPRLRILCLHGYMQSGPIFQRSSMKHLKERVLDLKAKNFFPELVCPTAPLRLGANEEGEEVFGWWQTEPKEQFLTASKQRGFEESFAYLTAFIQEEEAANGPFDGVIGFSQGGIMASLLCMLSGPCASNNKDNNKSSPYASLGEQEETRQMEWPTFSFKFAIMYSSFPTQAQPMAQLYSRIVSDEERACIPTLHCWGAKDDLVPPSASKQLAELFGSHAATQEHKGGHVIPTNSPAKQAVRALLNPFCGFSYGNVQG
ncbi:Ovarian cancer-associated protein 2 [Balamuthia mandrillaris]